MGRDEQTGPVPHDTKQARTALGSPPSGLALEELPATQRELDLFHAMRLTKKEQSCSQHLLTLSQLSRPRGERGPADHRQRKKKEAYNQQLLVQHLPHHPSAALTVPL